jgi:hypothetical protein
MTEAVRERTASNVIANKPGQQGRHQHPRQRLQRQVKPGGQCRPQPLQAVSCTRGEKFLAVAPSPPSVVFHVVASADPDRPPASNIAAVTLNAIDSLRIRAS